MFIIAVCVLFLIKLPWPRNKSLEDGHHLRIGIKSGHSPLQKREGTGKEYGCFPFV